MSTIAGADRLRQGAPPPLQTAAAPTGLVAGVDTHADTHTAAVLDAGGRLCAHATFPVTGAGYSQLWTWLTGFGPIARMGVEGTGAYGLGLTRHLRAVGVPVIEVDRSDRKARRFAGKADPLDAEAAARAVLAGVRTGVPKDRSFQVEALRVLRVARRSAVSQRVDAIRQIKTLVVTAPDALRDRLRHLTLGALIDTCTALRPDPARAGQVEYATKVALRSFGRRFRSLSEEIKELKPSSTRWSNRSIRPYSRCPESGRTAPDSCWSRLGPMPSASAANRPWR